MSFFAHKFRLFVLFFAILSCFAQSPGEITSLCSMGEALGTTCSDWKCDISNTIPLTPACGWSGVICSSGSVISITSPACFHGSIPTSIGGLIQLQNLSLVNYALTGTIPSTITALTGLTYLYLRNNTLQGSIPNNIGDLSRLQLLYLSLNQLNGTIPSSIGNLQYLTALSLRSNLLGGSIPPAITNCSGLQYLYLFSDSLAGSLPYSFGNLTNLVDFQAYTNKIGGKLPANMSSLLKLQIFHLFGNSLSGTIPFNFGQLTSLGYLNIGYNRLTGTIPSSINNLVSLTTIELDYNYLDGPLPSMGSLTKLQYLVISNQKVLSYGLGNQNFGAVPSSICNLKSLVALNLCYQGSFCSASFTSVPSCLLKTPNSYFPSLNTSYIGMLTDNFNLVSCPTGFIDGGDHKTCVPGCGTTGSSFYTQAVLPVNVFINSSFTYQYCSSCPNPSYITDQFGRDNLYCTPCIFPNIEIYDYNRVYQGCAGFFMGIQITSLYIPYAIISFFVILLLVVLLINEINGVKYLSIMMLYSFLPVASNLENLAYILTNIFYNQTLFAMAWLAYALPALPFMWYMYHKSLGVGPLLRGIEWATTLTNVYIGEPLTAYYNRCSFLLKILLVVVLFIPYLLYTYIFLLPIIAFGYAFFIICFIIGFFLFSSKLLAMSPISNYFFKLWTGSDDYDYDYMIDGSILNISIMAHVFCETIPSLIVQVINNYYLGIKYSNVAYGSLVFNCGTIALYMIRFLYYRVYLGISLEQMPLDLSIFPGLYLDKNPPRTNKKSLLSASDEDVQLNM